MIKLGHALGTWFLSVCSFCLLVASALHRLQLNSTIYTKSPLIPVEIILMIVVAVLILAYILYAFVLLIKKEWQKLGIVIINTVIGIGAFMAAMTIDAPTLVYMT